MRVFRSVLTAVAALAMLPSLALAQASIAGVVKDPSGGVLPGVTVEAASPALIEKVRTVVSDGAGLFSIENLRPGTYVVTFTLPGFNTVKRDGIELSGSANVTVNAELRVGSVEETITVTGEAPLVDVKSTTSQRVLNQEILQSTPTGRLYSDLGALVPGIKLSSGGVGQTQNVGGALGDTQSNMMIHGSKSVDMRVMQNGLPTATLQAGGGLSISTPNVGAAQEVTLDTAAVSAELPTGGPRINFIPRDGGNQLKGSVFASFANDSMQSDNFTSRLKSRGLASVDAIKRNADFNPGVGGPFKKDKVWFYVTARALWADVYPGGILPNLNANNRNAWTYVPDTSGTKAVNKALWTDGQLRTTWQASPRNKIAGSWEQQTRCSCPYFALATRSPEAGQDRRSPTQRILTAEWFSPVTNRLLIETGALHRTERWQNAPPKGFASGEPGGMIGVLEQSTGLQYRGGGTASGTYLDNWVPNYALRGAVSYITGSHSVKVGFNEIFGYLENSTYTPAPPVFYRFNNGIPNQVTQFATPYFAKSDEDSDFGVFAQDKWTVKRWTLTGGIRFDMFKSSFPEQTIGPALLAPTRQITFPKTANLDWKDITPRFGAVYDVFGDGRTAVRASMNKYLNGQTLNALGSAPNPILSLVNSASRSWNDANGNFVPDCDLVSVLANGECGSITANFGKSVPGATYDKDLITGWGNRNYNWEFAVGVQHQILPRLAVDVAYYRRIFGNFQATDNLALSPADFDTFSIVAPKDSRLPGGGGYTITGLHDVVPAKASIAQQNVNTLASNYGKQLEHWNGIDFNVNARFTSLTLSGGVSTGKTMTDNCEITEKLPEMITAATVVPQGYCHQEEPFITDAKFQAIYRIPKVDVQVAGTFSNVPGPNILANYTATNAVIQPSLGRPLSASAANKTVNLVTPLTMYGERLTQIDMRFSKIFRFGSRRVSAGIDVYNILNQDTILAQSNSFGNWQTPQQIIMARFVKLSATLDF